MISNGSLDHLCGTPGAPRRRAPRHHRVDNAEHVGTLQIRCRAPSFEPLLQLRQALVHPGCVTNIVQAIFESVNQAITVKNDLDVIEASSTRCQLIFLPSDSARRNDSVRLLHLIDANAVCNHDKHAAMVVPVQRHTRRYIHNGKQRGGGAEEVLVSEFDDLKDGRNVPPFGVGQGPRVLD